MAVNQSSGCISIIWLCESAGCQPILSAPSVTYWQRHNPTVRMWTTFEWQEMIDWRIANIFAWLQSLDYHPDLSRTPMHRPILAVLGLHQRMWASSCVACGDKNLNIYNLLVWNSTLLSSLLSSLSFQNIASL